MCVLFGMRALKCSTYLSKHGHVILISTSGHVILISTSGHAILLLVMQY